MSDSLSGASVPLNVPPEAPASLAACVQRLSQALDGSNSGAACAELQMGFAHLTWHCADYTARQVQHLGGNPNTPPPESKTGLAEQIAALSANLDSLVQLAAERPEAGDIFRVFYVGGLRARLSSPRRHTRLLGLGGQSIRGYRPLAEWCALEVGEGDLAGDLRCQRELRRYVPILREWLDSAAPHFRALKSQSWFPQGIVAETAAAQPAEAQPVVPEPAAETRPSARPAAVARAAAPQTLLTGEEVASPPVAAVPNGDAQALAALPLLQSCQLGYEQAWKAGDGAVAALWLGRLCGLAIQYLFAITASALRLVNALDPALEKRMDTSLTLRQKQTSLSFLLKALAQHESGPAPVAQAARAVQAPSGGATAPFTSTPWGQGGTWAEFCAESQKGEPAAGWHERFGPTARVLGETLGSWLAQTEHFFQPADAAGAVGFTVQVGDGHLQVDRRILQLDLNALKSNQAELMAPLEQASAAQPKPEGSGEVAAAPAAEAHSAPAQVVPVVEVQSSAPAEVAVASVNDKPAAAEAQVEAAHSKVAPAPPLEAKEADPAVASPAAEDLLAPAEPALSPDFLSGHPAADVPTPVPNEPAAALPATIAAPSSVESVASVPAESEPAAAAPVEVAEVVADKTWDGPEWLLERWAEVKAGQEPEALARLFGFLVQYTNGLDLEWKRQNEGRNDVQPPAAHLAAALEAWGTTLTESATLPWLEPLGRSDLRGWLGGDEFQSWLRADRTPSAALQSRAAQWLGALQSFFHESEQLFESPSAAGWLEGVVVYSDNYLEFVDHPIFVGPLSGSFWTAPAEVAQAEAAVPESPAVATAEPELSASAAGAEPVSPSVAQSEKPGPSDSAQETPTADSAGLPEVAAEAVPEITDADRNDAPVEQLPQAPTEEVVAVEAAPAVQAASSEATPTGPVDQPIPEPQPEANEASAPIAHEPAAASASADIAPVEEPTAVVDEPVETSVSAPVQEPAAVVDEPVEASVPAPVQEPAAVIDEPVEASVPAPVQEPAAVVDEPVEASVPSAAAPDFSGVPEAVQSYYEELWNASPLPAEGVAAGLEFLTQYFAGLATSVAVAETELDPATADAWRSDSTLAERWGLLSESAARLRQAGTPAARALCAVLDTPALAAHWPPHNVRVWTEALREGAAAQPAVALLGSWLAAAAPLWSACEHHAEPINQAGHLEMVVQWDELFFELVEPEYSILLLPPGISDWRSSPLYADASEAPLPQASPVELNVEEPVAEEAAELPGVAATPAAEAVPAVEPAATSLSSAEIGGKASGGVELAGSAEVVADFDDFFGSAEVAEDAMETLFSAPAAPADPPPPPEPRARMRPSTPSPAAQAAMAKQPVPAAQEKSAEGSPASTGGTPASSPSRPEAVVEEKPAPPPGEPPAEPKPARSAPARLAPVAAQAPEYIVVDPAKLDYTVHFIDTQGSVQHGRLDLKNVGGGTLKGTVKSNHPCLRVKPSVFRSNESQVEFWLDSSDLPAKTAQYGLTFHFGGQKVEVPMEQLTRKREYGKVVSKLLNLVRRKRS